LHHSEDPPLLAGQRLAVNGGLADPVVAGQIASEPEDHIQARTVETQRLHEFVFFIASIYRPPDLRQLDEAPHVV
jgi:hypothetical protein